MSCALQIAQMHVWKEAGFSIIHVSSLAGSMCACVILMIGRKKFGTPCSCFFRHFKVAISETVSEEGNVLISDALSSSEEFLSVSRCSCFKL